MAVPASVQEQMLEEAYSATPNYTVDPSTDERFTQMNEAHQTTVDNYNQMIDGMVGSVDTYYDDAKQQLDDWEVKQTEIQNQNTAHTIEKIEQQKDQAQKDYIKQQSGAYVDWRKQSNQYGTEAEKMASAGLDRTGFSESSQVSMYNAYQNRVAVAKESLDRTMMDFSNQIKDAQLQNDAILAEIAMETARQKMELTLEGFQYKNQLILDKANKLIDLENIRWQKQMDIYSQINQENALAEEVRQFTENQKWQTEQAELDRQFKSAEAELDRKFKEAQAVLDRQHDKDLLKAKNDHEKEMATTEHERKMALLAQELANDKALLKYQKEINSTTIGGGGGSGGSSGSYSGGSSGSSKKTGNASYTTKLLDATKTLNEAKGIGVSLNKPTPNMSSVLALGYGPISASALASKVKSGEVLMTTKNGQIYYSKNPNYSKNKYSFGR